MSGLEELGHDLGILAAALRSSPQTNPHAFTPAASRLREERPHESAAGREALARQLRLPLSLVEPWLEDTLELLAGHQNDASRRREAIERLSTLAWALGSLPQDWPPAREDEARRGWANWRDDA